MTEKDEVQKSIDEIKEWQDHQYDPGHWLGGNIPPYLLRRNKKLGISFFLIAPVWIVALIMSLSERDYYTAVFALLFAILCFGIGYKNFK